MTALQPQMMLKLINVFETSADAHFGQDGQRLNGFTHSDLSRLLSGVDTEVIQEMICTVGYAATHVAFFQYEPVEVDLEEDEDANFVRYRCPETFLWQRIPLVDTAILEVRVDLFLNLLADLLSIVSAERKDMAIPLIDNVLWRLGTAKLDEGLRIRVFLVRSLVLNLDNVIQVLRDENTPAIVLSTSKILPQYIQWPEGVVVCGLADAVIKHLPDTKLNTRWLYKLVVGGCAGKTALPADFPVQYDVVRHVLSIAGKPDWHVKGPKQRKAVQYMVDQAKKGRWELSAGEILAATRAPGQSGGAPRMGSLFSNSLEWQDYIVRPNKGVYSLKLD